jgi:hypothetical protein
VVLNIRRQNLVIGVFAILLLFLIPLVYKIILLKNNNIIPEPEKAKEKPSPYGEFLSWEEVDRIFPKYSKATVIDFETGLQFRVQRRAGKYHADVQPLTAEDTAVMKMIYDGKWSWKRKAIIVQLDNERRIAASMNGMPHGEGAIRGNKFNGHFCIHFRDSRIHTTREINMAHQVMVWKAAGRVDEQLVNLSPQDIIEVFFSAIDHGEVDITGKVIDDTSQYASVLLEGIGDINSVKVDRIENMQNGFRADVRVVYKNSYKEFRKEIPISLLHREKSGWKIDPRSVTPLIDKECWVEIICRSDKPPEEEEP